MTGTLIAIGVICSLLTTPYRYLHNIQRPFTQSHPIRPFVSLTPLPLSLIPLLLDQSIQISHQEILSLRRRAPASIRIPTSTLRTPRAPLARHTAKPAPGLSRAAVDEATGRPPRADGRAEREGRDGRAGAGERRVSSGGLVVHLQAALLVLPRVDGLWGRLLRVLRRGLAFGRDARRRGRGLSWRWLLGRIEEV